MRSRRVGPTTFYRLLAEHGSAGAALAALPGIAAAAGVRDYAPCSTADAATEIRSAELAGARMVARGSADYPATLAEVDDAPPFLWAIGRTELLSRPMIALVGARNASSLGLRMARRLAAELSEAGHVVVSGLARGIDTAAHKASLDGGTAAVLAGGVDVVYPPENAVLAQEIGERGLLVSEQPMSLVPQARHFPCRNRIVSGLARALVVVEAAARSGSLITAKAALDQGRDVLAVPGHPIDARAAGCNMLIRDGAILVRSGADILEALALEASAPSLPPVARRTAPPPSVPAATASRAETGRLHGEILMRLGPTPLAEDQLIRDLRLPAATVAPELVALELDGRIERHPGGLLARVG